MGEIRKKKKTTQKLTYGSHQSVADSVFMSLDQIENRLILSLLNQTENGVNSSHETEA